MFIAPGIEDSDDLIQHRNNINDGMCDEEFNELVEMLEPIQRD